ncbi:hypothetical protein [Hirschia litorea]|uniref:CopG family transcriptional regulator n=1 Tax=Hirschia litorea TaxID=1199156 RepID=A0ABW2IQ96_9PROT
MSHQLYAQLCERSNSPGVTKTQIVEAALEQYFRIGRHESDDNQLLTKYREVETKIVQSHRDIALGNEMLAQFILYWLTRTEPLPEKERERAHTLGQKRFEYFLNQVAQKIGQT